MTRLMSRPTYVEPIDDRAYSRFVRREKPVDSVRTSQIKSIYYSVIFAMLLWWIPVAGTALAGYMGGRKAGTSWRGLMATLVASSVIMFTTFALLPFKSGPLQYASYYFGSGVLAVSRSQLASASNVLTDMYTTFGLLRTFTLILPSSIFTLVIFGYVGGSYSELINHEESLHESYRKSLDRTTYSDTRNLQTLRLTQQQRMTKPRTVGIRPYNGGSDFDDDEVSLDEL